MNKIKVMNINELEATHKDEHKDYEYFRKSFLPRKDQNKTMVNVYEIPPLKSAYPYHYHLKNEETFYIISGEGILKTPEGEKLVKAGDLLFFPPNNDGAHKLTNKSKTENLVYIDFDVINKVDVTVYPDSSKIVVWGEGTNKIFKLEDSTAYYDGE